MTTTADFITDLYANAVDAKDLEHLSTLLADNVRFRVANHDSVIGKNAVLEANRAFFAGITSMTHHIDNIWSQGDDVICNGSVDYIRLDGSAFSAVFATILKLENDLISDYLVYADVSQL